VEAEHFVSGAKGKPIDKKQTRNLFIFNQLRNRKNRIKYFPKDD
jgi:hypothetical protein